MRGYKFCQLKAYFEKGYGLSHYFFKLIAVFGLTSQQLTETFIMIFFYTIFIFILGFVWYHFGFVEAEMEVANRYNLFVKEMRKTKLLNSRTTSKR